MTKQTLLSVGIDIGTTTTQLIVSRLTVENQASGFSVPKLSITGKEILYRSPIYFTPLLDATRIHAAGIREIVDKEYRAAGIDRSQIETGAVIITGETARKENADEVLSSLSGYAGDFVVATAGPALESVLAGKGAGCPALSQSLGRDILNLDIGGGTTNMALFRGEQVVDTGCLNVGGRLIRFPSSHRIDYVSPVLSGLCSLQPGQTADENALRPVAVMLAQVLEEALGLRERRLLPRFITDQNISLPKQFPLLCFSGGVADTIAPNSLSWDAFGDLGVLLGEAIRSSALFGCEVIDARETIRATVIGAGSHSTELSGSTIYYSNVHFPMKNLPVIAVTPAEEALDAPELAQIIRRRAQRYAQDAHPQPTVLALSGESCRSFPALCRLAEGIAGGLQPMVQEGLPAVIAVQADLGKALGQALRSILPGVPTVCLDSVALTEGMYLDIGNPVAGGQALPVVIKTLILS